MQERNHYTEIEDFLADESFQIWVRFNNDQKKWVEWTLEDPKRAKLVEEARLWLFAMKSPELETTTVMIQSALETTWGKIEKKQKKAITDQKGTRKLWSNQWFGRAAAVLVFSVLSVWFYSESVLSNNSSRVYKELVNQSSEGLVEQTNNTSKPQLITLSDGSSVLLQPNSKLSYPKIFTGNDRKVYLSGEGFFEISKNRKKPFYVFANEIITKVVGTSFRVRAFDNQPNVEVLVRTGKVEIHSSNLTKKVQKEEIVLLPNQALRFVRKNSTFNTITDITKDESLLNMTTTIEQLSFDFTDIPVAQIFKTIEQAYSVKIDFPESKLKNCYLTTSLTDQPLPQKLKIICKTLGHNTSYEMNGNQIIITSDGCN